jgi:hypothetical protein
MIEKKRSHSQFSIPALITVPCNFIVNNNGVMSADKTPKYDPETSVLKYRIGDGSRLNKEDFLLLSSAFFDEIESKFV